MTKIKPAINQFNGGEISPELEGRFDWDKYSYSAKLCKNFIPLVEGSLKRRGGSHFVSKTPETPTFDVNFNFNFSDGYKGKEVRLRIGETEIITTENTYQMRVELGKVIEYNIFCNGYISVNGGFYVDGDTDINAELIAIEDAVTLTVVTDPEDAKCYLDGVETKSLTVSRGKVVYIKAEYRKKVISYSMVVNNDVTEEILIDYVAYESHSVEEEEIVFFNRGNYKVFAVGGGGGAGGGTDGSHHSYRGGSGGGGAGFYGNIILDGEYTVSTGRWGAGGAKASGEGSGNDGGNGTATIIRNVISVGGGTCGKGSNGESDGAGGKGGIVTIYDNEVVSGDWVNGNDASGYKGGDSPNISSPYASFTNGKGGDAVFENTGKAGRRGYLLIEYQGRVK